MFLIPKVILMRIQTILSWKIKTRLSEIEIMLILNSLQARMFLSPLNQINLFLKNITQKTTQMTAKGIFNPHGTKNIPGSIII